MEKGFPSALAWKNTAFWPYPQKSRPELIVKLDHFITACNI